MSLEVLANQWKGGLIGSTSWENWMNKEIWIRVGRVVGEWRDRRIRIEHSTYITLG